MDLKKQFTNEVNKYLDFLIDKVRENKEFMTGMSIGAFLMTPPGRVILKNAAHFSKSIASLTKDLGVNVSKQLWDMALKSKLGKTNFAEQAIKGEGKIGELSEGGIKIAAAMIAGKAIGASLGKTIAAGSNWWQHVNPVSATVDTIQVLKEEAKEKKEANLKANEPIRQLAENLDKYTATGESNKISAYTGFNYDEEAKKLGLSTRPKNAIAENEWKKEVEKKMSKGGNHPVWYGKCKELATANLNYGVIKEGESNYNVAIGSRLSGMITTPRRDGLVTQAFKDAMTAIYVKMRGSNSGAFNYDDVDVAAYIECVRGIRAVLRGLQRDLKLVNESQVYESQTPDIYLKVAGYDNTAIADMKRNKILYMAELNLIADTMEDRYPLPPDLSVIDRTDYISDAVLVEGKSFKSSFYIYAIDQVLTPDGSQSLKLFDNTSVSYATKLANLRTLIDNMSKYQNPSYVDTTFTKIAGDMIKAYGEKALQKYARLSELDKVTKIYDEYLLHQLQNACGPQYDKGPISLTNNTNLYTSTVSLTITVAGSTSHTVSTTKLPGIIGDGVPVAEMLVNTNKNSVPELENLSLTRNIYTMHVAAATVTFGTATSCSINDCGTDILLSVVAYFFDTNDTVYSKGMVHRGITTLVVNVNEVELWSQIDYYPMLIIFDDQNNNGNNSKLYDLDMYAFMSQRQLQVFNDICTKSLYKTIKINDQANFKAAKRSK